MARKHYELLSINDASSRQMRILSRQESDDSYTLNVDQGHAQLRGMMLSLIEQGYTFDNCIFTTHGSPGVIWFGDDWLNTTVWYTQFYNRGYDRLFPKQTAKMYFAGCNVADGGNGWKFLEAAARSMLGFRGGFTSGWTSVGFGSPWSGKVRHLWGDTRQCFVFPGGTGLRFYTDWSLITDDGGYPVRP